MNSKASRSRYTLNLSPSAFLRDLMDGIHSRFSYLFSAHSINAEQDKAAVRSFYLTARGKELDFAIVDLGSSRYEILWEGMRSGHVLGEYPLRVLDFGCGGLTSLRLLLKGGYQVTSYTGVDLCCPPTPVVQGVEINLVEGDIESVHIDTATDVNTFVAANSLCYLPRLDRILATANAVRARSARFIVMEPRGPILWEAYFFGVRIFFRSPRTVETAFAAAGWSLQWTGTLYAFKIIGFFIWPVAQLYAFARAN